VSDDATATPLSAKELARVVALSSTIAGAVLLLYFVDRLGLGWFDPLMLYLRILMETDRRYTDAHRYVPLVFLGIWGVSWILAGLDSIRSPGSRRLAFATVAILIFGVTVALVMNSMLRSFTLRGIGVSP